VPLIPPIEGLDGVETWTNRDATTTEEIPGRLIILVGELPLERLRDAVPPFPTRSEIWLALMDQAERS
jgi:hypothetical protein